MRAPNVCDELMGGSIAVFLLIASYTGASGL